MKTYFQKFLENLGTYAIPIFRRNKISHSPFLVGSGIIYKYDSEYFLITAKHVIDDLNDDKIIISGKNGFIEFDGEKITYNYIEGKTFDHDVCIIRILTGVIENLHQNLKTINDFEMSQVEPYDKLTLYAFVGYPHTKNKPKPKATLDKINVKPFYYVVREFLDLDNIDSADKSVDFHLAFNFQKKFSPVNIFNNISSLPPDPKGISGCGVFMIKINPITGNIDKSTLVGIGIEFLDKFNALIATKIISPINLIINFISIIKDRKKIGNNYIT
jgi:hypothetical protein